MITRQRNRVVGELDFTVNLVILSSSPALSTGWI